MNIFSKLFEIQQTLSVAKTQRNEFSHFNFRSAEQIIEAVKPLLNSNRLVIILTDEIKNIGQYNYVEATAKLIDIDTSEKIEVKASAREDAALKGMSNSQITGATSSYSRKYALNGLFALDDNKDADSNEYAKIKKENDDYVSKFKNLITNSKTLDELKNIWYNNSEIQTNNEIKSLFTKRKKELKK